MKFRYRWAWFALVSFTAAACNSSPTSPTAAPGSGTSALPVLLSPINGGYVQQNDPQTNCRYDPVYGYGFTVTFEWRGVRDFEGYDIQLKHRYASVPLLEQHVRGTRYAYVACSVVAGTDDGWQWKVRTIGANGATGEWSAPFNLNFTPCRLSNGLGCAEQPAS